MRKHLTSFLLSMALTLVFAAAQTPADIHWPSFRGPAAAGVRESGTLPVKWNAEAGENLLWKREIPGLAHSSPIIWGDRIFLTTAVSSAGSATFKPGLYGDGDAATDRSSQQWKVLCLDKKDGRILWERTAYEGIPLEKRHIKATYANSTPATDGRRVVAFFGSQGLYAYDLEGRLLWEKKLGRLDVGAYNDAGLEWGTATSPILHRDRVILQIDTQEKDYLLALDADTGETVWRVDREELPSWGTPNIYPGPGGDEIITNASNYIRSNDAATGRELWRLGGSSQITAPTPVYDGETIVVASGRRPEAPIFVIKGGSRGNLTLPEGETSSESILWSRQQRGSYMPTPIIYQGYLYVLLNQGILDCYELQSGKEIYRERIPHSGSGFSASPVAGDGKLYLSSEDGDVFVVRAGAKFELLAKNPMGEFLMATPAVSEGVLYFRAASHLFAVR